MHIRIGWNSQKGYWLHLYVPQMEESHVFTDNVNQMIRFIRMMQQAYPVTILWHHTMTQQAKDGLTETFKQEGLI